MKTITARAVTIDQANKLSAIGSNYVVPASWKEPAGWTATEENETQVRAILAEQPAPPSPVVVVSADYTGDYDPGTVYYSITYLRDGVQHTATLSAIENAARGIMTRGMDGAPFFAALYPAARAAAIAKEYLLRGQYGVVKQVA